MRIQQSSQQGCVVLTLAGRLDLAAAPQVQRAILEQLARPPPAIICDLAQVEAIDRLCAGLFTSIRHPSLGWPGTALVLCGARGVVANSLLRAGVARRLAMYPSLDQALQNARARPPRLAEQLTLRPVPTAARAGRLFVQEVCDRWRLQGLAGSAALLGSELVTNAVVHARTALELRVELRGPRLYVVVHDQDPNLARLLAAKDGTGRGLGLRIVDRVATAWGVRQDEAGGKVVWCTLDLPPQQADMVGHGRQVEASASSASMAVGMDGTDRVPADAASWPGPDLVWTKLWPPALRAGLIPRASLLSLLQASLQGKLCLLDAPAGYGKTTLLAQWCAAADAGRVAWVSLDEGDNDPIRFWLYVIQALRTVKPGVGTAALQALHRGTVDLDRVVLPLLLNDLNTVGSRLVLVLDDYHLVTNPACHDTLTFFLDRLPPGIHLVLSTRVDPPLPLASMRASGELTEIRIADLQLTSEEASALLNGAMGLGLSTEDVARLAERTEGWAAGLYLAGLSLRGRQDPSGFIASFHGDNRHVADYLVADVLARQPEAVKTFLLRTSVLERLSGPLCDAVLETEGSSALLRELEDSNLFLVPLDHHREWYRYHQLFAESLRVELANREGASIPLLHRRAAAWHQQAGNVEEAIHHTIAAGEFAEAGALIARHWLAYWRHGRRATVARWLDGLPEQAIMAAPPVAFVAAWIGAFSGASKEQTERWLAVVEDATWTGALPDGISSLAFGAALAHAAAIFDDVKRSTGAARRALELADPKPSQYWWMAQAALGHALYLSGRSAEARSHLEELARRVSASVQPYAVTTALAVLSLIAGDEDDHPAAMALADRAAAIAEMQGLSAEPLCGIVYMAVGLVLTRQGRLAEAQEQLGRALELFRMESMATQRAHVLLLLASVRQGRGDLAGARSLVEQAHELIEPFEDPGSLPALLEQSERALGSASLRRLKVEAPLTERELAVLRLLPTGLSTREIGSQLYVSVNTIRSHVRAIYRKLGVTTRAAAVARARQLGLVPRHDLQPPTSPRTGLTSRSRPGG